mmetsp:Transcript_33528/g.73368  ORF Transcript_33528/g.73368 Transcript_33528/m.73368 type:complete len:314 (+) Transcript_33528:374-1315(+)
MRSGRPVGTKLEAPSQPRSAPRLSGRMTMHQTSCPPGISRSRPPTILQGVPADRSKKSPSTVFIAEAHARTATQPQLPAFRPRVGVGTSPGTTLSDLRQKSSSCSSSPMLCGGLVGAGKAELDPAVAPSQPPVWSCSSCRDATEASLRPESSHVEMSPISSSSGSGTLLAASEIPKAYIPWLASGLFRQPLEPPGVNGVASGLKANSLSMKSSSSSSQLGSVSSSSARSLAPRSLTHVCPPSKSTWKTSWFCLRKCLRKWVFSSMAQLFCAEAKASRTVPELMRSLRVVKSPASLFLLSRPTAVRTTPRTSKN